VRVREVVRTGAKEERDEDSNRSKQRRRSRNSLTKQCGVTLAAVACATHPGYSTTKPIAPCLLLVAAAAPAASPLRSSIPHSPSPLPTPPHPHSPTRHTQAIHGKMATHTPTAIATHIEESHVIPAPITDGKADRPGGREGGREGGIKERQQFFVLDFESSPLCLLSSLPPSVPPFCSVAPDQEHEDGGVVELARQGTRVVEEGREGGEEEEEEGGNAARPHPFNQLMHPLALPPFLPPVGHAGLYRRWSVDREHVHAAL